MTADPERLLGHVIRVGEVGTVVAGATLTGYVAVGAALLISGYTIQAYPALSLTRDPILNGLLAAIGFSTTVMCGGLFFLAQLTRRADWCIERWLRTVMATGAFPSDGGYDDE